MPQSCNGRIWKFCTGVIVSFTVTLFSTGNCGGLSKYLSPKMEATYPRATDDYSQSSLRKWTMKGGDHPRACAVSGKRMYSNEREANATATYRMTDKESASVQLRTYKCLYCGTWHLTSKKAS